MTIASFQFTCIRIFTLYPSALLQLEALCVGSSSCLPPPIIWSHWYKCWMFKIPVVKLHKISHFRDQSPEFSNSVTFGVMLKLSVFVQMKGVIYGSVRRRRAFHYRLQTAWLCFESQRWPSSLLQRSTWMAATRLNLYLWFFLKKHPHVVHVELYLLWSVELSSWSFHLQNEGRIEEKTGRARVFVSISQYVFVFLPVDLLGLLKWRSNTSLLQQNLRQLMKVEGGEVVKVRATRPDWSSLC